MMTKKFSKEEYYHTGHWKEVLRGEASYYDILGLTLADRISVEEIDRAHQDRWTWWKQVQKDKDSGGEARYSPKVEDAGPMVEKALGRLEQARETLRDKDKRRSYDQTLLEERTRPLLDYLKRALKDQILSEEEKQHALDIAAELGIDAIQAQVVISEALVKANAQYQRVATSSVNLYKQLGVPDFSSYPDIKRKYDEEHAAYINKSAGAKAAAKFHYDKIIEAFEVLKDTDKRRAHDEELKAPKGPVPLGVPVLTLVPDAPTYEFKNVRRGVTLSETIVIRNSEAGLLQGDITTDVDVAAWLKPDRNRLVEKHEQSLVISVITANIPRNVFHARGTVTITTNGGIGNVPFDVFLEDYGTELLRFKSAYVPLVASFVGLVGSIVSGTQLVWLIWPSALVFAVWNQIQRLVVQGTVGGADRIKALASSFAVGAVGGLIASLVVDWIAPSLPHLTGFVVGAWLGGFLFYLLARRLFDLGMASLFSTPRLSLLPQGLSVAIAGIPLMMYWSGGGQEPARTVVATTKSSLTSKLLEAEQCIERRNIACATAATDEVLRVDPRNSAALDIQRRVADQIRDQGRVRPPVPPDVIASSVAVPPQPVPMAQDPRTGCHVWKPLLVPNDAVMWSGPCVRGFAEGRGTAQWTVGGKNTLTYAGEFRAGLLQGPGKMTGAGGDRYEGGYRDGKREGRGVYIHDTGDRYDGEFKDNRRDGQGTLTRANGTRVEGIFIAGQPPANTAQEGAHEASGAGQGSAEEQRQAVADDAASRARAQQEERARTQNERAEAARKDADDAATRARAEQVERQRIQIERTEDAKTRSERVATAQANYQQAVAIAQREYQQAVSANQSGYQQKAAAAQRALQQELSDAQAKLGQAQSIAQGALRMAQQGTKNQIALSLAQNFYQQSVADAQATYQSTQATANAQYQQTVNGAQADLSTSTREAQAMLQQRSADARAALQLAAK